MNSIAETITDGTPPKAVETGLELPAEENTVTAPEPITGVDENKYRKAVRRILSKPKRGRVLDPWALSTLKDKLEISKIFSPQTVARLQIVDGLSVKQRLDAAIAMGEAMLNGEEDGKLNPELRFKGIAILAGAAKVSSEFSDQIMRLAEKAAVKGESGNGMKRKNLPPSTGIEITTGEGADKVTARVVATNGSSE